MIVLDACVLIAHLDGEDAHHHRAVRLLADTGDVPLAACVLTIGEVLVGPARIRRRRAAQDALDTLGLRPLDLPATAAGALADLRATTRLKMPDCCVLHTAETHGAQLATFDDRLIRAATDRGVRVRTGS